MFAAIWPWIKSQLLKVPDLVTKLLSKSAEHPPSFSVIHGDGNSGNTYIFTGATTVQVVIQQPPQNPKLEPPLKP